MPIQRHQRLTEHLFQCFRALCCKGPPPARPEYDLVCIGLTGSGKTSLLSKLCSESPENVVSTTGFSIKAVPFQNAILNVKELGGADNIRKYWSRYYQGSQGVIFVLDSASSEDDLEAARNELHSALQHPQLCTLPFLILANHQDKPAARSVQEVLWRRLQIQTASGSHPQCSRSVTRYLLLGEYKRHRGLKVKYSLSLEFGDLMSSPISATSCGRVT
uniref:ADP-ribosylation factor-like protein 15 n=1 Tax=Callithrix jacchus TaxID=9483 RepID=A0A8I3W4D0_CALJA